MERVRFIVTAAVVASGAIASIARTWLGWDFWHTLCIGFMATAPICFLLEWKWNMWTESRAKAAVAKFYQEHEVEFQLPLEQARALVERLLESGTSAFRCMSASGPPPQIMARLSVGLRDLFERYKSIECCEAEEMRLDRDTFVEWERFPEFICLGDDYEGIGVLALPDCETVFVATGYAATPEAAKEVAFPSIYHYLLCKARDVGEGNA